MMASFPLKTYEKSEVKVIYDNDPTHFESEINALLKDKWILESSSCGFYEGQIVDAQNVIHTYPKHFYQAILYKETYK